jgi:Mrp family chromosome partitioning ATPase
MGQDRLLTSEIHKLEARLWRKARRDGLRVIVVTSAGRGDGKSTTVALLGSALGKYPDRKILVVDLDLREPQLHAQFGMTPQFGWSAILNGECTAADAILKTDLPSLDLLLALPDGEDVALLTRTQELETIFRDFRETYDIVLLDVPALLPVADATAMLPLADGVILMAMAGKTTGPELTRAREICLGMEANIIGLVVGNLQEAIPEYGKGGYGYGYGDYQGSRRGADGNAANGPR